MNGDGHSSTSRVSAIAGDEPQNALTSASQARHAPQVAHFLRRYAIFLVLAGLVLFFQSREPAFLRINNLLSVLQSVAVVALLGLPPIFKTCAKKEVRGLQLRLPIPP